jgi:hypothetical protein
MARTIAPEDPSDAARAIYASCELFEDVCDALRETYGLEVSIELPAVRRHLDAVLAASP